MLFDRLDPLASPLLPLHPVFTRALEWLRNFDPASPDGIYEIEGREFFVNLQSYETRPRERCLWEAHRKMTDIQYCLTGGEIIRCDTLWSQDFPVPYQPEKDAYLWEDTGFDAQTVHLLPGRFVIFSPGEPHQAVINDGVHTSIRKAVVKISSSLLG